MEKRKALSAIDKEILKELEKQISAIYTELYPSIKKGEYPLIVGDDASGRIPALMIGRLIAKTHIQAGIQPPHIRFFAGGRNTLEENKKNKIKAIANLISKLPKPNSHQKALVVTEIISSGRSITLLVDALRSAGWQTDIAVLAVDTTTKETLEKRMDVHIISGKYNESAKIYKKYHLSGVVKNCNDVFSKPFRPSDEGGTPSDFQTGINETRSIIGGIQNRILEKNTKRPFLFFESLFELRQKTATPK